MTAALAYAAASGLVASGWPTGPPPPVPRTEVAAAVAGSEIVVAGGYLGNGRTTARVDLYDPARHTWRRGPALPRPLHHAAATTLGPSAVVVGGYASVGNPTTTAVQFDGTAWRQLQALPLQPAGAGRGTLGR